MAGGVALMALGVTLSAPVVAADAAAAGLSRTSLLTDVGTFGWHTASTLASTDLIMPLTALAVVVLLLTRHWHGALTLAVSVLATQAVVQLVKLAVDRPRPEANEAMTQASGPSFPSAHSATAVALYATLALVASRRCTGAMRIAVLVVGGAVVVAVGLSRIQLGAHYPIDVLAGWLTGAALVLVSWALIARLAVRPAAPAAA